MQNRRWIMSILDVCCLSETKTFEQFSDLLAFTLSSKNSHQFGQNQPTDKFHHSIESWEWGEEDRTWAGGLRRLWRPPKRRNISLPNSLATVVSEGRVRIKTEKGRTHWLCLLCMLVSRLILSEVCRYYICITTSGITINTQYSNSDTDQHFLTWGCMWMTK